MKEHGMLMKPPLILATLNDDKTMTRRVVAKYNSICSTARFDDLDIERAVIVDGCYLKAPKKVYNGTMHRVFPKYNAGDLIWIKEAWRVAGWSEDGADWRIQFKVDDSFKMFYPDEVYSEWTGELWKKTSIELDELGVKPDESGYYNWGDKPPTRWRSPLFMPKCFCRLDLRVRFAIPERLHDISWRDACREGYKGDMPKIGAVPWFNYTWESINAKKGYGWSTNPFVWKIGYVRADKAGE